MSTTKLNEALESRTESNSQVNSESKPPQNERPRSYEKTYTNKPRFQTNQRYQKDFNRFNSKRDGSGGGKEGLQTRLALEKGIREDDLDFEGAEPVDSQGKETDYKTKSDNDFAKFGLSSKLLSRLNELGYTKPFEIQDTTLAHTLAGK
jgi:hypothetical protein